MVKVVSVMPRDMDQVITSERMRRLIGYFSRRAREPSHAEDCLAEALLRVQSTVTSQSVRNLDALIVQTALHVEIDEFRRERRRGQSLDIADFVDQRDCSPLQDEVLMMRQRLERVKAGLAQLSPRTREALALRRLENLSYREIAQRMLISESAVEKHVAKGVRFLATWAEDW